jgi:hypothetical protein
MNQEDMIRFDRQRASQILGTTYWTTRSLSTQDQLAEVLELEIVKSNRVLEQVSKRRSLTDLCHQYLRQSSWAAPS